jgi:hypothetical protein
VKIIAEPMVYGFLTAEPNAVVAQIRRQCP